MNKVFARSFGFLSTNPLKSIKCMAIEITRNADYIYLGGMIDTNVMFFAKGSANIDTMIFTSVKPTTSGGVPSIRRMMIEKNVTLASQPKIYFCGATTANGGDMIFGRVLSTDLTSITIDVIF